MYPVSIPDYEPDIVNVPVYVSASEPQHLGVQGTLWFNTLNSKLYIWVDKLGEDVWEEIFSEGSGSSKATVAISSSPPPNPSVGDLWWNPNKKELKVWSSSLSGFQWVLITDNTPVPQTPPVFISVSQPAGAKTGFLWYNPNTKETKLKTSSSWVVISRDYSTLIDNYFDTVGKINGSLLYYKAATNKFTADGQVTITSLTDGGNF